MPSTGPIPHLETFCKAAELASFTRAAEALGLTQAAVSQHVRSLERELGVPLFHRRAGRVELADAGRTLYDYARRILDLHDEARAALGLDTPGSEGEVRLAASTVPAECLLPELLGRFRAAHPGIRVVAEVCDSESAVEALEQGKATIALVGRPVAAPWAESWPFASDRLTLVVSGRHEWAGRASVSAEELRTRPLAVREPGSGSRRCLEKALEPLGLTLDDLSVLLELGSNPAIRETAARGVVAAFASAQAVAGELASGRLHEVAVEGLGGLDRLLYVAVDRRRALPPPARAFLRFVREQPSPATAP
ncbi:LysR substrate-binding domain-containing protein [Tautonia plasticadhaerens]|nr:LysR substrate-binding domain-containing protein [Tautonia plasticadhaerens]